MKRGKTFTLIGIGLLLLVVSTGCPSGSSGESAHGPIEVAGQNVQVQFLTTNRERLKGVKHFPLIRAGEGALFVYPESMPDLYWTNRHLLGQELSVAFVNSNGDIIRIHRMKSNKGRVVNAGEPAQFILVVDGGWFDGNGVSAGNRMTVPHDAVQEAKPAQSIQTTRVLTVNDKRVRAEVASKPGLRRSGLMDRKALPEDQGMIFLYKRSGRRSFHMKNTLIPLDIAFLKANGTIAEIRQMKPLDRTSTRSADQVWHVLEMRKGWFREHDVKPGDQFDLTALEEFIQPLEAELK